VNETSKKSPLKHIPALDSMRGYFSLMILFMHIHESFIPTFLHGLHAQVELARMLVIWFFTVSGFLITRILLRSPPTYQTLKIFWLRRALRIFPVYYLVILVVFIFWPRKELIWPALYLSNYATDITGAVHPLLHTWSLCVEEHFYLLWPLLLFLFPKYPIRASTFLLVASILAAVLTTIYFPKDIAKGFLKHSSHVQFAPIAFGCLLASMNVDFRSRWWGVVGFLCSLLFIFLFLSGATPFRLGIHTALFKSFLLIGSAMALFCLIMHLTTISSGPVQRFFSWGPMILFGKMTYGFYLIHYATFYFFGVLHEYQVFNAGNWWALSGAVSLTFALTLFSYYFIETPLNDLKKYFKYSS
jgi:peptidoglycan/LPS O-acetylase OafA/YrhL